MFKIRNQLIAVAMTAVTTLAYVTTSAESGADEAYPGKPIRIIVPVAARGFQDVISGSFAQRMSAKLGQTIIIENRASAGSLTGTRTAAKAPADGYTLLFQPS